MAVSRGSSNGPDWRDVITAVQELEEAESVAVEMCGIVEMGRNYPQWRWTAHCYRAGEDSVVRAPLASASVTCSATSHADTDAALLALVYALDFQLAANEYKKAAEK